ncbi:Predicted ATP-dependent carboligase, ATP-grasp superfamily [Desulfocicer vacuolatum DSM 3385]|uniref:Predicted ATP-dependent carboligase, ATP-grasp superfamily n=1 Tax=Desulfocicer vacuolatum DSM 3385 TaxID=1121400 RepID=A0A1W1ZPV3_9BACT|nr:ATP-grasp domain-containing protein [Desulfocicer vacuolatum]SMC50242.1 Predicted ATP-dependent carboligase, ATP-grasp superfamily [Desulfocicer vacuolatum DSM 3385]
MKIEKKKTILITEGENRSSLAATRSLGRAGYRVMVTGGKRKNISSASRFCSLSFQMPSPEAEPKKFIQAMEELLDKENIDYVLPMTEPALFLLSQKDKGRFGKTRIIDESSTKLAAVFDKLHVFKLAIKKNIAVPKTSFISTPFDFFDLLEKGDFDFPVVIKPGMSKIYHDTGFVSTQVCYAEDQSSLMQWYERHGTTVGPFMVQEKIDGPGTGLFTLFDTDKHLALFSHRRLLEKPPSGGISVYSESVPLDPEMVEASRILLSEVRWQGVAMVEFKRDARDGKAKLMEINGRLWGSLQLAVQSGVDFPLLLMTYMEKGLFPNRPPRYEIGTRLVWILGLLDHFLIRIKPGRKKASIAPIRPSAWKAFQKTWFDVLDPRDLGPFLFEIQSYATQLIHRR